MDRLQTRVIKLGQYLFLHVCFGQWRYEAMIQYPYFMLCIRRLQHQMLFTAFSHHTQAKNK